MKFRFSSSRFAWLARLFGFYGYDDGFQRNFDGGRLLAIILSPMISAEIFMTRHEAALRASGSAR